MFRFARQLMRAPFMYHLCVVLTTPHKWSICYTCDGRLGRENCRTLSPILCPGLSDIMEDWAGELPHSLPNSIQSVGIVFVLPSLFYLPWGTRSWLAGEYIVVKVWRQLLPTLRFIHLILYVFQHMVETEPHF